MTQLIDKFEPSFSLRLYNKRTKQREKIKNFFAEIDTSIWLLQGTVSFLRYHSSFYYNASKVITIIWVLLFSDFSLKHDNNIIFTVDGISLEKHLEKNYLVCYF